jgi:hypothetical protein
LTEECIQLAKGVHTYDVQTGESFTLHAYLLTFSGDLPAMSKLLCLKGHNGYSPCRCCLIHGQRIQNSANNVYYPALQPPTRPGQPRSERGWNPNDLPPRTRENLQTHLAEMASANTATERERLSMKYGVHRQSMLLRIPSLEFPYSFPHNIMHLIFENICPLLCEHWTASGRFKNTEPSDPGYRIAPHIWSQIGLETTKAYRTIPSIFVGAMPDIINSKYKAEFWSFWVQYLGPILLRNRFPNAKYYRHFCDLTVIIRTCLQFTITDMQLTELQTNIVKWVQQYERYAFSK